MTTEIKKRKNTDYSASAINLNNNEIVKAGLYSLRTLRANLQTLTEQANTAIPQALKDQMAETAKLIAEEDATLRKAVEEHGSYQDVEAGEYALKQKCESTAYNAAAFETAFPQFAPAIVVMSIDETKLKGLIKGGLITEDDLSLALVTIKTELAPAFIIK